MEKKVKSIGKNAAMLGIAGIIVKIIGAIYRIPITAMITDEGLGYYQTAYPIYEMMLAISTAGLPVAISKMVAASVAQEKYRDSKKILRLSMYLMGALGIFFGLMIFIFAERLANFYKNPGAYYSMVALVPAMVVSPMLAGIRGYYQGRQIMGPTAISQVLVQGFRLISGLVLAKLLLPRGLEFAAGGATLAAGIGSIIGLLYMFAVHFRYRADLNSEVTIGIQETSESKEILKEMIMIALPISIGAAIVPIMDSIDIYLVMDGLQAIGFSPEEANLRFAWLKGMAQTLINMPQVFAVALGVSIIPVITSLVEKKKHKELEDKLSMIFKLTFLLAFPCMVGLFSLSYPIISLIYPTTSAMAKEGTALILKILSLSTLPLMLITITSSIMQAFGKERVPVLNLLIGAVVKIILTTYLTRIPSVNVYGAAIGSVVGYTITSGLNIASVNKYMSFSLDKKIIIYFIASIIMGLGAYYSQALASGFIGPKLATLAAIIVAVVIYFGILLVTKSFTKEDFEMLRRK